MFKSKKKDAKLLYTEALEHMLRGDNDTAFWKLRELVKIDTNHINAYIKLGDILREKNKTDKALKIHQSLTARPRLTLEQKVDIYSSLAKDFFELKDFHRAEENANQILQYDKKNKWAARFLIKIAEHQRQWLKASEYLKRLERLTGTQEKARHAYFRLREGKAKEDKGNVQEAKDDYLKAIKIDPNYAESYLYLADLFENEEKLEKAVEYWMRFAELSPKSAKQVFAKLEKALFHLGRFGEIEDFYSRIISKDAENVDAISGFVNVLLAKGELDRAMALIDDVLVKNEKSVRAHLARLKLSLRKIDQDQLSAEVDRIVDLIHGGDGVPSIVSS